MSLSPADIVDAGRHRVHKKLTWFTHMLYKLKPVERVGFGTFAVDDGLRMFYDPALVTRIGVLHVATFLAHEVQHIIREHHKVMAMTRHLFEARYDAVAVKLRHYFGITSLAKLYNHGGDIEINLDLERIGWEWPEDWMPLLPSTYNFPTGLAMVDYVRLLIELAERMPEPQGDSVAVLHGPGQGTCGGCAGNPADGEPEQDDDDLPPKMTDDEVERMKRQVAHEIVEYVKSTHGRGDQPGDYLYKWAHSMFAPPKVDPKVLLANVFRGDVAAIRGRVDYKFGRPSRRREVIKQYAGDAAPLLPTLVGQVPRVGLAIDTSGSMGSGKGSRLGLGADIVLGVARASNLPVHLMPVDARVQDVKLVRRTQDIIDSMKGGGGTDMRVGIKALQDPKLKLDLAILLTDGETPWPTADQMPKRQRFIVVVINDDKSYFDRMPKHMKKPGRAIFVESKN